MHPSLIGALLMAAVTTAGDYAWFQFGIRHTPVAGVIHGVILLATLGALWGMLAWIGHRTGAHGMAQRQFESCGPVLFVGGHTGPGAVQVDAGGVRDDDHG